MIEDITLKDTGKLSVGGSITEADIVASGETLTFFGVEVTYSHRAMLSLNPPVGKHLNGQDTRFDYGEVDHIGSEQPTFQLRGVFEIDNAVHRVLLGHLNSMVDTKGYKEFGSTLSTVFFGGKANVQVRDIRLMHNAEHNIINYTAELVVTR
jgi:hypothetical protein